MKYEYKTVPLHLMLNLTTMPLVEGSYISKGASDDKILALLESGFRWVRSEGNFAILERALE